jgi:hypothetical protein
MSDQPLNRLGLKDALAIWDAGRRAASSGHAWAENPFLRRENMPAETGEALDAWSAKHDAWQSGFESSSHPDAPGGSRSATEALLLRLIDRIRRPSDC